MSEKEYLLGVSKTVKKTTSEKQPDYNIYVKPNKSVLATAICSHLNKLKENKNV